MATRIDGWTLTHGTTPDGLPMVTATKPDRNTLTTIGEPGTTEELLTERVMKYATQQDDDAGETGEKE